MTSRQKKGSIFWKIPPGGGGGIPVDVIWGKKYEKAKRKKGKYKRKGRKRKEKERKRKKNEKRGSKRVK
jgi:hypothetical protein